MEKQESVRAGEIIRKESSAPRVINEPKKLNDFRWCVCIPAFQAAGVLASTIQEVKQQISAGKIFVADDGSTDDTSSIARASGVQVLRWEQNRGKGAVLASAFERLRHMEYQWVITLDADGQHSPADLPGFLQTPISVQTGVIAGCREFHGQNMPRARIFSNTVSSWLVSKVVGERVHDSQCGYRAYNLDLSGAGVFPLSGRFEWESEVLIRAVKKGFHILEVPVRTIYDHEEGSSHIRAFRDTARFLKMLAAYL